MYIFQFSSCRAGTFGFTSEYGAEKKVSKYSSVAAHVSLGVPSGVYLKLKVIRSTQTFVFPIHISAEIVPAAVFYATTTPVLIWFLVKKVVIDPMNADQKRRSIEKSREVNKQRMAERKREAEASIGLMSSAYERSRDEEQKRHGLIIDSAVYGKWDDQKEDDESTTTRIDVHVPLQCLVKGSKLLVTVAKMSELPGFYDPCVGEEKQLKIDYTFRDQQFQVTVEDNGEPLRIPTAEAIKASASSAASTPVGDSSSSNTESMNGTPNGGGGSPA